MDVLQLPMWSDNYAYLICHQGRAALVDAPEAAPVEQALEGGGLTLAAIWNTHHHLDHVGANPALLARHRVPVTGSLEDEARIPGITRALREGDTVSLDGLSARVLFVPGHTRGHIAYYLESEGALFCGDTLFAGGCGRLFEGTAEQMVDSLSKLRSLPDKTRVYCAHEYTLKNLEFALSVEPGNEALRRRMDEVRRLRERGEPTVPSLLGVEKETNPFLRWDQPEIIASAQDCGGARSGDPVSVFAAIRQLKDHF